jgi:hypothetical protein
MLKAIGKSINIRVSGNESATIPIVILGNSPITESYVKKVDFLKESGVIQNFISLNPIPTKLDFVKSTPLKGFITASNVNQLLKICENLVNSDLHYFSSMISKKALGQIITISNKEKSDIARAEKFLTLIRS